MKDFGTLYEELDERTLLGFGGVSEYGITVRWDKNFLTLLYITLARNPLLRIYGGVRFGGTMTLDDAWTLGFDHVALAAGAGRPTIIDMKNNLARGIRKASDFLMALQLTGAYKKSSLANLQVQLPAVVIGGGLTAIDTATELLAYYPVQLEKVATRIHRLTEEKGAEAVRAMFDEEEWEPAPGPAPARDASSRRSAIAPPREGRDPRLQPLLDRWGGVTLVYRALGPRVAGVPPQPRGGREEPRGGRPLRRGPRARRGGPRFARPHQGREVRSPRRATAREVELPARTLCVAAGTSPNTMYEKEYEGTFALDTKKQYFQVHTARRVAASEVTLTPADEEHRRGVLRELRRRPGKRNVVSLLRRQPPVLRGQRRQGDGEREARLQARRALCTRRSRATRRPTSRRATPRVSAFFDKIDDLLVARVVEVEPPHVDTSSRSSCKAPLAARKFKPGQFYRLQNFESFAPLVEGTRLAMEGLALTGAWIDEEKGLLGTIVLEMGSSSRLCAALRPGEPVVLMGPDRRAHRDPEQRDGHARRRRPRQRRPLLDRARLQGDRREGPLLRGLQEGRGPLQAGRHRAVHRPGHLVHRHAASRSRRVVRRTPRSAATSSRPSSRTARARSRTRRSSSPSVKRIIAIGSDRMMAAVKEARHGVLQPMLDPRHLAIGSINSPMQCMMKEVCAQCLQKHKDPLTGKETLVFSCYNQDQELDSVDFKHLNERLRANSMQEKLANAWLEHLLGVKPDVLRI